MEQKIQKAYASAPKTWLWQLLAAFIVACLLAWSGTAVHISTCLLYTSPSPRDS